MATRPSIPLWHSWRHQGQRAPAAANSEGRRQHARTLLPHGIQGADSAWPHAEGSAMCTWTHSSASSVCRVQCCSCCLPSHCVCIVLRTFVVVQRLGTVHAYFSTAGEHSKRVLHYRVEVEVSAAGEHSRCVLYIKSALDSDASDRRPIWSSKVRGRLKMAVWAVAVLCGAQGSDQVRCCSVA
jgi:hypothetical protein